METLLLPIILALLSGGGLAAFLTYKIARRKVPAEVDSIVVQSSETANLSLARSLAAAEKERDRLVDVAAAKDAEIARKDARIEALEAQLDRLQIMLNAARDELAAIRRGE